MPTLRENQEANHLMTIPFRDNSSGVPRTQVDISGVYFMADTMSMPHVDQYPSKKNRTKEEKAHDSMKYVLVVVDMYSRKFDAYPLYNQTSEEVLRAFREIRNRNLLSMPKEKNYLSPPNISSNLVLFDKEAEKERQKNLKYILQQPTKPPKIQLYSDNGGEFKKFFSEYCTEHNIKQVFGKANRHRNQGMVEKQNARLARYLFVELHAREKSSGKLERDWLGKNNSKLNKAVKALNESRKYRQPTMKVVTNKKIIMPGPRPTEQQLKSLKNAKTQKELNALKIKAPRSNILFPNDEVHIIKEQLKDVENNRLIGFRATDKRWEEEPTKIKNVVGKSGMPLLYSVRDDGVPNRDIYYTRAQLLQPLPGETTRKTGRKRVRKKL